MSQKTARTEDVVCNGHCSVASHQAGLPDAATKCDFFLAAEQTADSIVITDRAGRVEYVNPAFESLTGYDKRDILNGTLRILKSGYHPPPFYEALWRTLLAGRPFKAEFVNRKKDGSLYIEEKSIAPISENGNVTHFISAGRDVTREKQHLAERARFTAVQEATSDLIAIVDADKRVVYVNPAGRRMLGLPASGPLPENITSSRLGLELPDAAITSVVETGHWTGETVMAHPDGRRVPLSLVLVAQRKIDGDLDFIAAIGRDLSARKQLEMELRYAADHDSLTDIFNRRRFEQELRAALATARAEQRSAALLVLDLDDFKSVNDSLGHGSGDKVLRSVAATLQSSDRQNDVVARLGGDEFAIILMDVDSRQAIGHAQYLLQTIRGDQSLISGEQIRVTASIGIAMLPDHGSTVDELLTNADIALYDAKDRSRNSVRVYDPRANSRALSKTRFDWRNHVADALDRDLLQLYSQPILNLHTSQVEKYELLLRISDENDDVELPQAFLLNAELSGLAQEVDRWVVRQALQLMAGNQPGESAKLAINLSPTSLSAPGFSQFVRAELSATDADPANVVFEITEAAAIRDMRAVKQFIRGLKSIGCLFALDDFGTGFSSLALVRDLPVDYIKVDGSFVANLGRNRKNEHIIRAIVDLAHGFGRQTIAEFVDSQATARRLKALQVDYAQGFHIGVPTPVRGSLPHSESIRKTA